MPKKRSDLWFFRTGDVVTIVGLKPTDFIIVNEKVRNLYATLVSRKVGEIDQVHGAKRAK